MEGMLAEKKEKNEEEESDSEERKWPFRDIYFTGCAHISKGPEDEQMEFLLKIANGVLLEGI